MEEGSVLPFEQEKVDEELVGIPFAITFGCVFFGQSIALMVLYANHGKQLKTWQNAGFGAQAYVVLGGFIAQTIVFGCSFFSSLFAAIGGEEAIMVPGFCSALAMLYGIVTWV